MNKRLLIAIACYAAIALAATFTLDGGMLRNAVWVLMAGLALKTWAGYKSMALQDSDRPHAGHSGEDEAPE